MVGGLDLFPPGAAIPIDDYTCALDAVGIGYELLDCDAIAARWPQFALPAGTVGLFQERGRSCRPPGHRAMQELALCYGADLRDRLRSPRSAISGRRGRGRRR